MCYYLQKVQKQEVLSMKCDFYRDTNNKIWLFYANDILTRERICNEAEKLEAQALEKQKHQKFELA
jgi:hypothetical protein